MEQIAIFMGQVRSSRLGISMAASYRRASILSALVLSGLLLSSCQYDRSRPCDPELEALLPDLGAYPHGTGRSAPDSGVSAESGTQPVAVCHASYSIPSGAGGPVNLYRFDAIMSADNGFNNLVNRASFANPDHFTPYQALKGLESSFRADGIP